MFQEQIQQNEHLVVTGSSLKHTHKNKQTKRDSVKKQTKKLTIKTEYTLDLEVLDCLQKKKKSTRPQTNKIPCFANNQRLL